jgi:hypothetical protein
MLSLSAGLLLPACGRGKDAVDAGHHGTAMKQRQRKLVGTFGLLALIVVYCIVIGAIYLRFFEGQPGWMLILFFAVTGMLWFYPASWTVRWMAKPDA